MKYIIFLIQVYQGKITVSGTFIGKRSICNDDTFTHPSATVGFGDYNSCFVRI
jgi:hypothetical protein